MQNDVGKPKHCGVGTTTKTRNRTILTDQKTDKLEKNQDVWGKEPGEKTGRVKTKL